MLAIKQEKLIGHIILSAGIFFSLCADTNQLLDDFHVRSIQKNRSAVMCVTIPKSGTHLLMRAISALNVKGLWYDCKKDITPLSKIKYIQSINKNPPPNHYKGLYYPILKKILPTTLIRNVMSNKTKYLFFTHCPYLHQFDQLLQFRTTANFFMIRDPRAMVVSFAFMVHKSFDNQKIDIEKIILDMITGQKKNFAQWGVEHHEAYPLIWEVGLYNFYNMYLPWANTKKFVLIKFEDLVGKRGGGSAEKQRECIKNIGQHLNVKMTKQKIDSVINNIFGETSTFREGKIDSWKKYFTPEIKAAFQQDKKLMQLLIDLGYEQNNNW